MLKPFNLRRSLISVSRKFKKNIKGTVWKKNQFLQCSDLSRSFFTLENCSKQIFRKKLQCRFWHCNLYSFNNIDGAFIHTAKSSHKNNYFCIFVIFFSIFFGTFMRHDSSTALQKYFNCVIENGRKNDFLSSSKY